MAWLDDLKDTYVSKEGTIKPPHSEPWEGEWLCVNVVVLSELDQEGALVCEHTTDLVTYVPPHAVAGSFDAAPAHQLPRPGTPQTVAPCVPPEWFIITPVTQSATPEPPPAADEVVLEKYPP